jgi:hypothetical protein
MPALDADCKMMLPMLSPIWLQGIYTVLVYLGKIKVW